MPQSLQKYFNLELEPEGVATAESPIRFVASTPTADRIGDRVFPSGIDLTNYTKNPIVLFDHDHKSPIGTAKVWVENDKLLMEPTFSDASGTARETAALVRQGVLKAVSIGFLPLETKPNQNGGFDIIKSELLEVSIVSVPMNQEALRIKAAQSESEQNVQNQLEAIDAKLNLIMTQLTKLESMMADESEESTEVEPKPEEPEEPEETEAKSKSKSAVEVSVSVQPTLTQLEEFFKLFTNKGNKQP
jgi:HK97 family phage prohead protease